MSDDDDKNAEHGGISPARLRDFFEALKPGNAESVRRRIKRGIPVDVDRDGSGYTPLHVACLRGADDVVALLLERGADPHQMTGPPANAPPDSWAARATPTSTLQSAAYGGNARVVEMLFDAGAQHGAAEALAQAARKKHWPSRDGKLKVRLSVFGRVTEVEIDERQFKFD